MLSVINEHGEMKSPQELSEEISISKSYELDNFLQPFAISSANRKYWIYQFLYEKITWIWASAQLIANSACSSGYKIISTEDTNKNNEFDTEDEKSKNGFIKALEELFEGCNREQSFSEIYRQLHIDLAVAGKCYLIFDYLEEEPPFKTPIAIYRADFRTMRPVYLWSHLEHMGIVPEEYMKFKNVIIGWCQEIVDNLESFIEKKGMEKPPLDAPSWVWNGSANTRFFYPDQVIEIKLDANGASPLDCLEYSVSTELAAQLYTYAYFKNGTKTGLILSMEKGNAEDARKNKEWLKSEYSSPENAWYPMFLLGGIKLVRESANTSDVKYLEIRDFNREECCSAMGTYPSLIGSQKAGSGSRDREEDKLSFESETVRPREVLILDKITRHFYKIYPDQSNKFKIIPGIKSRASLHLLKVAQMQTMFGGTINEARNLVGLPSDKSDKIYDTPFVAANLLPANMTTQAIESKLMGSKTMKDNNTLGQPRDENVQGERSGVLNEQR